MAKYLKITLIATLFAFFAVSATAKEKKEKQAKEAEVTFVVEIDCEGCANKVRENLPFEKGVKDLKVTLADKTVWIKYSPKKTTKEQLASAINKLGYQVLGEKQEQPVTE